MSDQRPMDEPPPVPVPSAELRRLAGNGQATSARTSRAGSHFGTTDLQKAATRALIAAVLALVLCQLASPVVLLLALRLRGDEQRFEGEGSRETRYALWTAVVGCVVLVVLPAVGVRL